MYMFTFATKIRTNHINVALLTVLLALTATRGMMYAAVIPPWQAAEEPWHYEVARLNYEYGRTVSSGDRVQVLYSQILDSMRTFHFWEWVPTADPNPQGGEFHQPQLYYQLMSVVLSLAPQVPLLEQLFLLRLATVMLGILVVALSCLATKLLFPDDIFLQIGVPTFIIFLPTYAFSIGTVNNDKMAEVAVTLTILFLVLILKKGPSLSVLVGVALSLVLGYYSKRTFIFAIPLTLIGVVLAFWLHRTKRHVRWLFLVSILLFVCGLALLLWDISLLGTWVYRLFGRFDYASGPLDFGEMIRVLSREYPQYARGLFKSFWGMFGWGTVQLAVPWFGLLLVVCLMAALGLVRFALKQPRPFEHWQYVILGIYFLAMSLSLSLAVVTKLDHQTYRWPDIYKGTLPQARYIFPTLLPIATLFTLGLRAWILAGYERLGLVSYVLGLAGLDTVAMLGYIVPFFYSGALLESMVWGKSGIWASQLLYVLLPLVYLVLLGVFLRLILRQQHICRISYDFHSQIHQDVVS